MSGIFYVDDIPQSKYTLFPKWTKPPKWCDIPDNYNIRVFHLSGAKGKKKKGKWYFGYFGRLSLPKSGFMLLSCRVSRQRVEEADDLTFKNGTLPILL